MLTGREPIAHRVKRIHNVSAVVTIYRVAAGLPPQDEPIEPAGERSTVYFGSGKAVAGPLLRLADCMQRLGIAHIRRI